MGKVARLAEPDEAYAQKSVSFSRINELRFAHELTCGRELSFGHELT